MADERSWLEIYEELHDEYAVVRDEYGDIVWEERSPFGGDYYLWKQVIEVSIRRVELSLDPWHVEIQSENGVHCLVERFWDDKEAWDFVRRFIAEVGFDKV